MRLYREGRGTLWRVARRLLRDGWGAGDEENEDAVAHGSVYVEHNVKVWQQI